MRKGIRLAPRALKLALIRSAKIIFYRTPCPWPQSILNNLSLHGQAVSFNAMQAKFQNNLKVEVSKCQNQLL